MRDNRLPPTYTDARGLIGRHKHPLPTPAHPLVISASSLRDWLRCRLKWHWRHQARIVPKRKPEALAVGGLVHEILQDYYSRPHAKRSERIMRSIAAKHVRATDHEVLTIDNLELIEAMCRGYAVWAADVDREIGVNECTAEKDFDLPLDAEGRIRVHGRIDLAFAPTTLKRTMACREFKTKSQIRIDLLELNLQLRVYLWALRGLYPKMKRFLAYYTILRKQTPGPRVTAELFHQECVEASAEDVELWRQDAEHAAWDMLGAAIYPSPIDACAYDCDYTMPCLLRANASDLRDALERDFEAKTDRPTTKEA